MYKADDVGNLGGSVRRGRPLTPRHPRASMIRMARMSMKKFAAVVRQAIETLPEEVKEHLENVVVDVEAEPSVEFLRDAGFTDEEIDEGDTLYGYFMPMEVEQASEMLEHPNRIIIFRNPLVEDFPDAHDLLTEIRKTVVH